MLLPRLKVVATEQMLVLVTVFTRAFAARLTATSILSLPTSSMLRMTFFSIFTSCESFLAKSGPKAPAADLRKACPERLVMSVRARRQMIFNSLASVECLGSDKFDIDTAACAD
jgi:hypothetical protein